MNERNHQAKYIIFDFLAAAVSWFVYYLISRYHNHLFQFEFGFEVIFDSKFYSRLALIPIIWLAIYYFTGFYRNIYHKSRLKDLGETLFITFIGVAFFLLTGFLKDHFPGHSNAFEPFFSYFIIHFVLSYTPRLIITTHTIHKIHNRKIGFNTLLIGSDEEAVNIYKAIESQKKSSGNKFIGFVNVNSENRLPLARYLPHMGGLNNLQSLIQQYQIQEVIVALESSEHDKIEKIINKLYPYDVIVKAIPSMYDILTGKVKMSVIFGTPLIQITNELMPPWQEKIKQVIDYVVAFIALLILSPVFLFLILGVKFTSKGPVLYSHERIGKYGKPFRIYKFRSMYQDAEKNGPALSSKEDSRITPFGRFMRKTKMDEIPNFINVLKGHMSLVGPRPERQYYIDQIVKRAPHYMHLLKVKPGITSWGQVKYGYAENVDQMIERLKYDILYIENMSLYVDFKILIYTAITVVKSRGI